MDLAQRRPGVWMERWTLLELDDLSLFGFAPGERMRSGLSWVRTRPLVQIDWRLGCALTDDGTIYGLGRRFRLADLTDEEGWSALRLLTERRFGGRDMPRDDLAAAKWLAARVMARWLDVPPPPWRRPGLVDAFIALHTFPYLAARPDRRAG